MEKVGLSPWSIFAERIDRDLGETGCDRVIAVLKIELIISFRVEKTALVVGHLVEKESCRPHQTPKREVL